MPRRPREPWFLGEPEEVVLDGLTHRAAQWDNNQKLTDCGIHYHGRGVKEKDLTTSSVDCMACIAGSTQ